MSRRVKRILLIIVIFAISVATTVVLFASRTEPPKREVEEKSMLVDVMELQTMTANFKVQSQGTVKPRTQTKLSSEISGTITSISPKFIPGGVFSANETLMRVDPANYEVAVRQAEALLAQRKIEFDGATKLRSQGYRAESDYASARAALVTAEAELVRAKRNLERSYIRLPYAGMVYSKDADLGQFVNPGTPLGVVFATDFAEVRLSLTDQDLAFVALPDAADISASGSAEGPSVTLGAVQKGRAVSWPARIVRTEGVVDESSRVTYVVARIEDPYALKTDRAVLPVGTFVTATIEGAMMEDVIRVPRNALRGSDQLIFVDDEDRLRIRTIEILRSDADFVYLSSGVEAGERVVLTAIEMPVNGTKVRVEEG